MSDAEDRERIMKILEENESLDFVQRILSPENYPILTSKDDDRLKGGSRATHQMSDSSNADGTEFYVYPEIVNDNGFLHWFKDRDDAFLYAEETGERITFNNKKDAAWFAKNYKKIWPGDDH